ncbi:MAG TPA: SDR family oxidoreductase [Kiritimatiellia bacterium]|uniref:SDR family oxidoreductase n=1 Tax=Hydrogenophaga sp. TaxID=1904254 RepID=UPI002BF200DE|nr:SDR family oxidoreductase [Hydrogenophaga sp.]HMO52685.1 SDR family oxidoreductase [Kiritimatiellia bacterium]HMP11375.1 SDR family oxidoreductase [Hydrogenophaga sp.]
MLKLSGKTAVVVGGTHGMGLATVRALVDGGAMVLLSGRNKINVEKAQTEFKENVTAVCSDVSSLTEINALVGTATEKFGQVDALFVFAAVAEFEPFSQVSEGSFDRQFGINAKGAYFVVQGFAPIVRDGGSITLATVTPATASPGMSVYMGTKAAVRAFAQVFAAELLDRKIRVNALAPGFIDTPTLGLASLTPEERKEFHDIGDQVTPMKRHGTVSEIADAALFLAFGATFTTGIELPVDGGLSTVDNP